MQAALPLFLLHRLVGLQRGIRLTIKRGSQADDGRNEGDERRRGGHIFDCFCSFNPKAGNVTWDPESRAILGSSLPLILHAVASA